jgi:LPXTG-motif cell wall-anchored protein
VDCTFDYWVTGQTTTATHGECPTGEIVDVVTAEGFGDDSKLDVGPVDDCEEIDVLPAVEVFKSTDTPNIPATGAEVTFDVVIHNRTIHDLTLGSLTDSVDGGLEYRIDSDSPGAVVIDTTCDVIGLVLTGDDGNDASGTDQYTCEFTVAVSGVGDQVVRDTVTVEGCDDQQNCVEDDDYEDVTLKDVSIKVTKTVTPTHLVDTGDVTWTIVLENDGDWPLFNVKQFDLMTWRTVDAETLTSCEVLTRDVIGAVVYIGGALVPGDELYAQCTTPLEFDVHGLIVLNSVTAIGDAGPIVIAEPEVTSLSAHVTPVGCEDADLPDHAVCGFDTATVTIGQVEASGLIGDTVWYDCSTTVATDPGCDNAVQDAGELGIAGAKVTIVGLDGQDVDPDTTGIQTSKNLLTDVNGKYLFSGLPPGNYNVKVLIGDVPDAQDRTLRFTTASSYTILLPEGGQRLDADFGVIADTLPNTGISADEILVIAILLLIVGSVAVVSTRRKEDETGTELAA